MTPRAAAIAPQPAGLLGLLPGVVAAARLSLLAACVALTPQVLHADAAAPMETTLSPLAAASTPADPNVPLLAQTVAQTPLALAAFPGDLTALSDVELTLLNGRWAELEPLQRRALLRENRERMRARASGAAQRPAGRVRIERRFGVVRRQDGGVVAVERRKVVRVQPGQRRFGVGFERRQSEAGIGENAAAASDIVPASAMGTVAEHAPAQPAEADQTRP
ncbi:MAG: hypothetical protein AAF515_00880 [Pseudomonadota bacterium]